MPQLQTQLNARSADFQANAAAAGAILLGMSSRPAAALAPASQIRIAVALVALGATLGGCSATSDQTPVTLPAQSGSVRGRINIYHHPVRMRAEDGDDRTLQGR